MYKKILVPVDGSSTSLRGMHEAIRIAEHCGATIRLIHVVNELIFDAGYPPIMNHVELIDGLRANGQKVLQTTEALIRQRGISCETKLIETFGSHASQSILTDSRECGADVIVMGTHGRRGIRRLALGSDAEVVLRHALVPVLFVRDATEEAPRTGAPQTLAKTMVER
jgi:nucleotide-binding universal stress UspA family protein